jgi:murein DD-endopeptidase MepM/ murein hydrolase activator NlpD
LILGCADRPPAGDTTRADTPTQEALRPDSLTGIATEVVEATVPVPEVRIDTALLTPKLDDLTALAASMIIPVEGVAAGALRDNYTEARAGHTHEAIDILAPRGTPVLSATDGTLTKLHASIPGGLMIYAADATDQFLFMYGHLDRYADDVKEGMTLTRGQVIGYVGTTGNAPPGTPHLHFAVARGKPSAAWWKGVPINPYPLLSGKSGLGL